MEKQNNILTRKFLAVLISIFFLVLFTFLIVDGYLNLERDKEIYVANAKDMIFDRVNSLLFELNIFPQDIGNDVLFLGELSSLNALLNSTGDSRENSINSLGQDFLNYIRESPAYYQLSYIDQNGQETVKAEFNGRDSYLVPKDKLLDKKEDFYFKETSKLKKGEIYFSKLGLNVKNGLMENIGTEANPVYVPTIRIATPVFDSLGVNRGIVVFSIYVDYFLEDIRLAQRNGESLFLITQEGYYLAHPDKEKQFGSTPGKVSNFYDDYPMVPREYSRDVTKRIFEDEKFVFSFKQIRTIPKGAKIFGVDDDYSWILVDVSDKAHMNNTINSLESNYIFFLVFSGIIILTSIALIILFSSKRFDLKREK